MARPSLAVIYRPKDWQSVVEQDAIKKILDEELKTNNLKHVLMFTGGAGTGKAQPLYSKVLTPTGFVNMEDVKIGMEVFTASGNIAKISEIFPQGKRAIYEITLQDDTKIRVADNHLNCVYRYNQRLKQREDFVWETTKLIEEFKNQKYKLRIDIPEVDFKHQEVLINPYLLGCLIGDGSLSNNLSFTCAESDILDKVNSILKQDYGMILKHKTKYDYSIRYIENPNHNGSKGDKGQHDLVRNYDVLKTLKGQLDSYKLLCKSLDKHIPKEYLYNSKEVRLALLQGLYDTDGWKGGRCYSTSSKQLAQDFLFLVRSLGIRATIKESTGKYNGILCNTHYKIHLKPNKEMRIFSSKKHYANYLQQQQEPMRNIKSIEYIGEEECQCIMVDHPDHTYISDDFIPTHNTTSARIFANTVEPTKANIIEINCADHTGVDDVRQLILDVSRTKPLTGTYKIFILDECFTGDTLIATPNGNIPIKDIKIGDNVYNAEGISKVIGVAKKQIPQNRILQIKINGKWITTTREHLFFTKEGWVKAQDLKIGNFLYAQKTLIKLDLNKDNIEEDIIIKAKPTEFIEDINFEYTNNSVETMYDLQIEGHPSYFVNDILVHNCHMLTPQSQNALLKMLEEPPAHCIYILCTTDPQKVLGTILSRAFRYDFQLISTQGIISRLNYILEQEGWEQVPESQTT